MATYSCLRIFTSTRLVMGSVSKKVLDKARCPVLLVRIPDEEMVKAGLLERG